VSNEKSFVIRIAQPRELPVIQELNGGSFENDLARDPYLVTTWPTDPETGERYFRDRLSGDDGIVFAAEADGCVVGYLAGAMRPIESYRRGVRSELENMFVRPEARRTGVGSALVDAFVDWSKKQGADEVYVSAYFDNRTAVSFYQSKAFESYAHDLLLDLRGSR
jgi:GNAT superfamily N-acetyltransferase